MLPIGLSLAEFPGWIRPLPVVGLFVVLELFSNMVLETWLYGQSAGCSQVALLIAIAFWTWPWGPVGLLLATPLTVCVVVLAKHVPAMEFIAVLMTDEPVLRPEVRFYQRLLADDQHEAADILEELLETTPLEQVYDTVLVPALTRVKTDRAANRLTDQEQAYIVQATADILDDLVPHRPPEHGDPSLAPTRLDAAPAVLVLGLPALDDTDEPTLRMLKHLLHPSRWTMEVTSPQRLASEVVALVAERTPAVVCIGALPSHEPGDALPLSLQAFPGPVPRPHRRTLGSRRGHRGSAEPPARRRRPGHDHAGGDPAPDRGALVVGWKAGGNSLGADCSTNDRARGGSGPVGSFDCRS